MPRPYRAMNFYCPVGRGDPTPPGNRAVDAICLFGCRGEHCSPVRFTRQVDLAGWLQRAVNDRPYKSIRKIHAFPVHLFVISF